MDRSVISGVGGVVLSYFLLVNCVAGCNVSDSNVARKVQGCNFNESEALKLDVIRDCLSSQEDVIIYSLVERSQYCFNARVYNASQLSLPGFKGSLLQFLFKQTENLHSKLGRYGNPAEVPFFPDGLDRPLISAWPSPKLLYKAAANVSVNDQIWRMYFDEFLGKLVSSCDDGEYGNTALSDIALLQDLSKRIHYGKFVAESKFQQSSQAYTTAIRAKDSKALMRMLTDEKVEESVVQRVEVKAKTYGQQINTNGSQVIRTYKVDPSVAVQLYSNWVMPFTKQVELQYLLRRLD